MNRMKTYKPNAKLPKGAKLVKPFTKKLGSWCEMEFDAKCERLSLTWLRVRGGFSRNNQGEDWVADIPWGCLSISDYNWEKSVLWTKWNFFGSFDKAIAAKTKAFMNEFEGRAAAKQKELNEMMLALEATRKALKPFHL